MSAIRPFPKQLFILLLCAGSLGQMAVGQSIPLPAIEWQLGFGGTNSDILTSLQQTTDGGYIFGGYSRSPISGNKTSPHFGLNDFWVLRLDANGDKLWERSFGGTGEDELFSLQQTSDEGFVLGGRSTSS